MAQSVKSQPTSLEYGGWGPDASLQSGLGLAVGGGVVGKNFPVISDRAEYGVI